jgi:hypothetical protein
MLGRGIEGDSCYGHILAISHILHFSHLYGIIEMLGLNKKEFDHNVSNQNITARMHRRHVLYSYQLLFDTPDIL